MKLTERAEELLEALWIGTVEAGQDSLPLADLGMDDQAEALRELETLAQISRG
jgi:hypothetical protein